MQAYMTLQPTFGGFDAAIIAVQNTTFNNNFTITGSHGQQRGHLHHEREPDGHQLPEHLRERLRPQRPGHDDQQQPDRREPVGERLRLDQQPGERHREGDLVDLEHLGQRVRSGVTRPPGPRSPRVWRWGGPGTRTARRARPRRRCSRKLCQVAIAGVCNALPVDGLHAPHLHGRLGMHLRPDVPADRHADRGPRRVDQPGLQPRDRRTTTRSTSRATSRSSTRAASR